MTATEIFFDGLRLPGRLRAIHHPFLDQPAVFVAAAWGFLAGVAAR